MVCIFLTLGILCSSVQLATAYNDAVAIALPVDGIQIDGDLSDWPKDLPVYRIRMNTDAYGPTDLTGTRLDSSADFSPRFRVGYSVQEQLVYVALEVRDDILTLGDGCEIYWYAQSDTSDVEDRPAGFVVEPPYGSLRGRFKYGDNAAWRRVDFPDEKWETNLWNMPKGLFEYSRIFENERAYVQMAGFKKSHLTEAVGRSGGVTVYEWALAPLGSTWEERVELKPGLKVGFDVVSMDFDQEGDTQAWVAWSPGTRKNQYLERMGQLILAEKIQPAQISGTVRNIKGMPLEEVMVRVESEDEKWVDLVPTGLEGNYLTWTLPGTYRLYIPGAIESDTLIVKAETGSWHTGNLSVRDFNLDKVEEEIVLTNATSSSPEEENRDKRVLWLRYHMTIDPTWSQTPLVFSTASYSSSTDTVEYFFNGEKLPSSTVPFIDEDVGPFSRSHTVLVLDQENPNLLSIRYALETDGYLNAVEQGYESIMPHTNYEPLDIMSVDQNISRMSTEIRYESTLHALFVGVPATFAVMHMLLFIFYPRGRANLFFSLISIAIVLVTLYISSDYSNPWPSVVVGVALLTVWALLRFLYVLFYEGLPSVFWVIVVSAIYTFIFALCSDIASNSLGPFNDYSGSGHFSWDVTILFVALTLLVGGTLWLIGRWHQPWPQVVWWWSGALFLLILLGNAQELMRPIMGILVFGTVISVLVESARVLFLALRQRMFGALTVSAGMSAFIIAIPVAVVFDSLNKDNESSAVPDPESAFATGVFGLLAAMSIHLGRSVARTNNDLEEQLIQVETLSAHNLEQERALRTRMEQELEEARQLQLSMLPHQPPEHPHVDIAWHMKTATEVGGDYYDYVLADDGTLTFTLGDATGHGMNAGTLVSATKGLFLNLANQPSITEIFVAMSRALKGMNLYRISMAMNMVKIKDNTLQVSSAGIPPILLYQSATQRVQEILIEGLPLGFVARARYEQQTFEIAPGDTLLMMSDGLPERTNSADEEFGYPRVQALFGQVAGEAPETIIEQLIQGGEDWAEGQPQDDDVTLVVLKMKDPNMFV